MTYNEWCIQISKELDSNIPRDLVKEVIRTAIRVAIEEILSNKANADLSIGGVGRFYLNHERFCNGALGTELYRWVIRFKACKALKAVMNDEVDVRNMLIAGKIPLYPSEIDESIKGRGRKRNDGTYGTRTIRKYIMKYSKSYESALKKEKKKKTRAKLPKDKNE